MLSSPARRPAHRDPAVPAAPSPSAGATGAWAVRPSHVTRSGPTRRRVLAAALGAPAVGLLGACGGGDDGPREPLLRFVNGTADVSPATFLVDDIVARSVGIGGRGTVYGAVTPGVHTVSVASTRELERQRIAFYGDTYTTVVAHGKAADDSVQFWVLDEATATPGSASVRLRAWHAAAHQPGPLAVYLDGASASTTPLFALSGYGAASGTSTVPPGRYRVRVLAGTTELLNQPDIELPGDSVWHLAIVPRGAGAPQVHIAAIRERGEGATWGSA